MIAPAQYQAAEAAPCRVTVADFGAIGDAGRASLFCLRNSLGTEILLSDLGASIVSVRTTDRAGRLDDIVLGYDRAADYLRGGAHMGAVAGRHSGRIAGGCFALGKQRYNLSRNAGAHHLHGGREGFNKKLWIPAIRNGDGAAGLRLTLVSPDGDEGYPGTLEARVTYTLNDRNDLIVDYLAWADRPTVVNLTQHSYFNLSGDPAKGIGDHLLEIAAKAFLPVNADMIPSGEIWPVAGTPMDFRAPKAIGRDIDADDPQLRIGGGYDHTWVVADRRRAAPEFAARLVHTGTGRTLTLLTDQPGLQLYTANSLDNSIAGKGGAVYGPRQALCLEAQNFPDAPNHENFPSAVLAPGDEYRSRTILNFGVQKD